MKKVKLQIVALQKPKGGWKVNCPDHGVQPLVSIPHPTPREIGGMACKKCLEEPECLKHDYPEKWCGACEEEKQKEQKKEWEETFDLCFLGIGNIDWEKVRLFIKEQVIPSTYQKGFIAGADSTAIQISELKIEELKKVRLEARKECKKELHILLDEATCELATTDFDLFAEYVIEWMNEK